MINMTNDPCHQTIKDSNIMFSIALILVFFALSTLAHIVTCQQIREDEPMMG